LEARWRAEAFVVDGLWSVRVEYCNVFGGVLCQYEAIWEGGEGVVRTFEENGERLEKVV
jgi:hypothetical protein